MISKENTYRKFPGDLVIQKPEPSCDFFCPLVEKSVVEETNKIGSKDYFLINNEHPSSLDSLGRTKVLEYHTWKFPGNISEDNSVTLLL